MMDRKKQIELIKQWRTESERAWERDGYSANIWNGAQAIAYTNCADQLQKLVSEKHTGRYCADCNTLIGPDEFSCPKCGGCL